MKYTYIYKCNKYGSQINLARKPVYIFSKRPNLGYLHTNILE